MSSPPGDPSSSYKKTRLNAVRHGLLSVYTVLPWEDEAEYGSLLGARVEEYAPSGPTEDHLIEEIAGVSWRKRRLRLAEAAAHRRGLEKTTEPFSNTVSTALVQLTVTGSRGTIIDAVTRRLRGRLRLVELEEAGRRGALDIECRRAVLTRRWPSWTNEPEIMARGGRPGARRFVEDESG